MKDFLSEIAENEQVELNEETRARLDAYFEKKNERLMKRNSCIIRGASDINRDVNYLLNQVEMLEIEQEVLFDALLIAIQRNEDLHKVTDIKNRLVYYINNAFHWTGNFDRNEYDVRRLYELAEEHNKTRRYDNPIFKKWRR